jgi:hypothetical protein
MLQCDHPEGEGAKHGEPKPSKPANKVIHGFLLANFFWLKSDLFGYEIEFLQEAEATPSSFSGKQTQLKVEMDSGPVNIPL